MNIILMGYRGSGKTSIGRQIASQTWKDFVDSDHEVVARFSGRSIAEIWADPGEPAFRAAEAEVVQELVQRENHVIALGGGAVMHPDAADAIRGAPDARRIYLACRPAVLAQRLADDPATAASRPPLRPQDDASDPAPAGAATVEEITAVLAERDPVYRELADVVFDVTYLNLPDAVAYLARHHL
ncbi:MAG: shikimate kinase [Planctomycetota bacterium]